MSLKDSKSSTETSATSKQSNTVKSKTPEAPPKSIAEIVKSNPKPMTSNLVSSHPSNKENSQCHLAAGPKGQPTTSKANTSVQNSSNEKIRPAQLPNGLHTGREGHHYHNHHQTTNAAHRQSKPSNHKPTNGNPAQSRTSAQSAVSPQHPKSKFVSDSSTTQGPTSPDTTSGNERQKVSSTTSSPTVSIVLVYSIPLENRLPFVGHADHILLVFSQDSKLSYAAMAQRTAAAAQPTKPAAAQDAAGSSATSPSGDSNNNSGDNVSAAVKNPDKNLYQTKNQSGQSQPRAKPPIGNQGNQIPKSTRGKGSTKPASTPTAGSQPSPAVTTS